MFGRQKAAALVAEFLGAGVLTLLVLSVQRSTIGVPFFVAIAAGLAIVLMSFAVGGISGGHFNPALTIGLWTARKVSTYRTIVYIAAQMLGGWAAYYVYTYFVRNPLQPVGGHATWHIFAAEAVGAGIFTFAFAATVFQKFTRPANASFAGLALTVGIVAASSAAIGLLNPSVALGVRAFNWAYALGPVAGAVIGVNLYALLFAEAGSSPWAAALETVTASSSTTSGTAKKKSTKKSKK